VFRSSVSSTTNIAVSCCQGDTGAWARISSGIAHRSSPSAHRAAASVMVGRDRRAAPPGDQSTGTLAPESQPTMVQPVVAQAPVADVRHDDDRHLTVRTETAGPRIDRIRWSAVWAGLAVALALYLFLQLSLVAAGIVDLSEATSTDAWWSAGAALVAFLIGGVVAGATAVWRGVGDGLLHGIVMWAVGLVALIALAAFGGGIALGSFDTSNVFDQFTNADPCSAAPWETPTR
jgi:hypothetical protein